MNIEKLAIEAGFEVFNGRIGLLGAEKIHDVTAQLEAFAKALQSSEPVAEPLRINLGFGKYGVHHGTIDKVPCLTISNIGTGLVGEQTKHENMTPIKFENEVLSITFANKESFEVFRQEVNLVFTHPPASVPVEKYNNLLRLLIEAKYNLGLKNEVPLHNIFSKVEKIVSQAIAEAEGKEG